MSFLLAANVSMVVVLVDVSRVRLGLEVQVVSLEENQWVVSSVKDVGPDSNALGVEADIAEIKVNMRSPAVGVFWVFTGSVISGEDVVSVTGGACVIPRVKVACELSALVPV